MTTRAVALRSSSPRSRLGEQERAEMVGRESQLSRSAVSCRSYRDHASVVDQDVEPVVPGQDFSGQPPDLRQARQVRGHSLYLGGRYTLAEVARRPPHRVPHRGRQ